MVECQPGVFFIIHCYLIITFHFTNTLPSAIQVSKPGLRQCCPISGILGASWPSRVSRCWQQDIFISMLVCTIYNLRQMIRHCTNKPLTTGLNGSIDRGWGLTIKVSPFIGSSIHMRLLDFNVVAKLFYSTSRTVNSNTFHVSVQWLESPRHLTIIPRICNV